MAIALSARWRRSSSARATKSASLSMCCSLFHSSYAQSDSSSCCADVKSLPIRRIQTLILGILYTKKNMKPYQFLATDSRSHAAGGRVRSRTRRELHDKTGDQRALWPLAAQFCSALGKDASCPCHLLISTNIIQPEIGNIRVIELEMLKPLNFSARPVVHFSGPARNKIFYFRPVWARENILSSMFYNKTTNYLELTDLRRRRMDFGSREEHTAKNYSTETSKNFIYKLAYTIFK